MGGFMTDASMPSAYFAEGDFRAGRVFNRTFSVFSRNLLPFCLVTFVASLPNFLIVTAGTGAVAPGSRLIIGGIFTTVLSTIAQAVVVYGAFEDMRGQPVNLVESFRVGLRRFFPVLGVAICVPILAALAAFLLIIPGLIVFTMLYVAVAACVVERLGTFESMGRSAQLTKRNRWKIFGLWFAVLLVVGIVQGVLSFLAKLVGGPIAAGIVSLIWTAVFSAFNAILAVVTYHDLRVAKEGVDTEQIAAVFD
jgi:hypothetical protein